MSLPARRCRSLSSLAMPCGSMVTLVPRRSRVWRNLSLPSDTGSFETLVLLKPKYLRYRSSPTPFKSVSFALGQSSGSSTRNILILESNENDGIRSPTMVIDRTCDRLMLSRKVVSSCSWRLLLVIMTRCRTLSPGSVHVELQDCLFSTKRWFSSMELARMISRIRS